MARALAAGVLIHGMASGAGFQITSYLVSRYAGMKNFGKIFGAITSTIMAGPTLGPLMSGYLYEVTGSYDLLLSTAIPVVAICALMFLRLGPHPDFHNKVDNLGSKTQPSPAE